MLKKITKKRAFTLLDNKLSKVYLKQILPITTIEKKADGKYYWNNDQSNTKETEISKKNANLCVDNLEDKHEKKEKIAEFHKDNKHKISVENRAWRSSVIAKEKASGGIFVKKLGDKYLIDKVNQTYKGGKVVTKEILDQLLEFQFNMFEKTKEK